MGTPQYCWTHVYLQWLEHNLKGTHTLPATVVSLSSRNDKRCPVSLSPMSAGSLFIYLLSLCVPVPVFFSSFWCAPCNAKWHQKNEDTAKNDHVDQNGAKDKDKQMQMMRAFLACLAARKRWETGKGESDWRVFGRSSENLQNKTVRPTRQKLFTTTQHYKSGAIAFNGPAGKIKRKSL